jgi:hypothetical protein
VLFEFAHARGVRAHERFEEPPVRWYAQVQKLVSADEVLEVRVLMDAVAREDRDTC